MKLRSFVLSLVIAPLLSSCVMFNSADFSGLFDDKVKVHFAGGEPDGDKKIAILPLHGTIIGTDSGFPFAGNRSITPRKVEMALNVLARQEDLAALVLEINSPGGSAAASEEILAKLNNFKRQRGIPIVAYYIDMATSGGYYISQSADVIVANPNTMTGSIGVVLTFPRVDQFLKKKLDIEMVTFKSGKFKDSGSIFRKMSSEEKSFWQKLVMQYYDRFVKVVAQGRKIPEASVRKLSQGQVMHPEFALKNKFIDQIGHLNDALVRARLLAAKNIKGEGVEYLRVAATEGNSSLIPNKISVSTPFDQITGSSLTPMLGAPGTYRAAVWFIY